MNGADLIERYGAERVEIADTLLSLYRALRIGLLMQESGHSEWEGMTQDDLGLFITETSQQLGVWPDDPERSEALKGFIVFWTDHLAEMPYAEYLQTPEWKSVRRFALWRARDRCQTCNASGRLHVHHRTYARRGHEHLDDVTVLCAGCHKAFHENRKLSR